MPRGIKNVINYSEQIEKIDTQLQSLHKKEKFLLSQRKIFQQEQQQNELRALQDAIYNNGLSILDAQTIIEEHSRASEITA